MITMADIGEHIALVAIACLVVVLGTICIIYGSADIQVAAITGIIAVLAACAAYIIGLKNGTAPPPPPEA